MKKVLFVLGLALCSTFAMAQTNKVADKLCVNPAPATQKLVVTDNHPIDYKASIFTKDDDVTLAFYTFGPTDSIIIDVVRTGDRIDNAPVLSAAAHNRTQAHLKWHRIADSAATHTTQFTSDYAELLRYMPLANMNAYMGVRNDIETDNGFMILSISEDGDAVSAYGINTYFQLAPVALPANMVVADITWRQYYRKYYDVCYIDYWKGNSWISYEINVTGIDVSVGGTGPSYSVATLPSTALDQDSLKFRFRLQADGGNYYGYGWLIDDVKVIVPNSTPDRWSFNSDGYINGFYGTLPKDFQIPISYEVFARNTSVNTLVGNSLSIQHRVSTDNTWSEWSEVFSVDQQDTMQAGNPLTDNLFEINESGFMYAGGGFNEYRGYHAFPEYYQYYGTSDQVLENAGYQRRSLPTETVGKHQFSIIANNESGDLSDTLDIMTYTVSGNMGVDSTVGRTVPGYRWGNDNGIVPGWREFGYGFTSDNPNTDYNDAGYATSDCEHQYEPLYEVLTRYNTPSVIPTDDNGEPWVIRGIEYVTSTKLTAPRVEGATIIPQIYRYQLTSDTSGAFYNYIGYTGLTGSEIYEIGGNSAPQDEEDLFGYNTLASCKYYCYNILFPEQPALEPNVSFLLGYDNNGGGDFAVAATSGSYQINDSTSTAYRNSPALADYARQLSPLDKVYDAYCYDPIQGARSDTSRHTLSGWNIEVYPMIRLIVGPKMEIPHYDVYLNCGETEGNFWIYNYSENMNGCGMHDTVAEGSSRIYYVIPGVEDEMEFQDEATSYYYIDPSSDFAFNTVIDQILVDGTPIDLTDENLVTPIEYNFYWYEHTPADAEPWAPAIERTYYALSMRNIGEDHVITAVTHTEVLGINNTEDYINLTLAPNPATSQVRLNIAGFAGKANCSIIDMSGRVIYNADITAGETVLSLNDVPAGAYFVRVTNDSFSKVEKLIVR